MVKLASKFRFRFVDSWLGPIACVARADRLVGVYLPGSNRDSRSYQIKRIFEAFPHPEPDGRLLDRFVRELSEYFEGKRRRFTVPLELHGSDFTRRVLAETMKIGFGQTISYKSLAERIGRPRSYRAVGNALGANRLPIVVPCHRVISSDGGLGGFGYGPAIKRELLIHETHYSEHACGLTLDGIRSRLYNDDAKSATLRSTGPARL